jgi:hypothetical protein
VAEPVESVDSWYAPVSVTCEYAVKGTSTHADRTKERHPDVIVKVIVQILLGQNNFPIF